MRIFLSSQGNEPARDWLRSLAAGASEVTRRLVETTEWITVMARKKRNPHIGSDFEAFLAEEGQLEGATAVAIKRVLAWQIAQAMKDEKVSQAELARRMKTSRAVIHRLLDADDPSVTLSTISRAAAALGRNVRVQFAA